MNVSNKTYHIKEDPYFAAGERIIADFVSANHEFNELSIGEYEGDTEIWYIDRDDTSASVLAYANGQWEIEYRYITFADNVDLSNSSYQVLTWAYDEYIEPKRLRISYNGTTKLAKINGMLKGSFACEQGVFPFDNRAKWPTPAITLDGSTLSTELVEGVTKYKVYSNGSYIGYVDPDGTWHAEGSQPEPSGFTVTIQGERYLDEDFPDNCYYKANGTVSRTDYDGYVDSNGTIHGLSTLNGVNTISFLTDSQYGSYVDDKYVWGITHHSGSLSFVSQEGHLTTVKVNEDQTITVVGTYD